MSSVGIGKYGDYLEDRLSSNTKEVKNTRIFLQELEHRLGKADFSKFLDKFKDFYADVD